jgi:hypothetical protein
MFKRIINFIFRKNQITLKLNDSSIITVKQKKQIDKIWNNIDKMSGYGITVICLNAQENDLAVALAHSTEFIIKRFIGYLNLNSKVNVIKLIYDYKTVTNEDDGYRMKSHIINLHNERFMKEKLIEKI